MVFVREGFIAKQMKNLKLYVLNLPLLRESGALFLFTIP